MSGSRPSAQSLVDQLRERGELTDARLERAFLRIPREAFLPGLPPEQVYQDEAIPIQRAPDGTVLSSSSQPSMMALMIGQMRLSAGMNVLEIGTGSGYNAAILQEIVGPSGRVTTVEVDPVIAAQARDNLQRAAVGGQIMVITGDGAAGYAPRAAYDRVIATAGIWDVPRAWVRQLRPRGGIVAPLWLEGFQYSAALQLQPDGSLYSDRNLPCGFVRLRGTAAGPRVEVQIGSAMVVYSSSAGQLDAATISALGSDSSEGYVGAHLDYRAWNFGALLYVMLTLPPEYTIGSYYVAAGQRAFGVEGSGTVVASRGSVCFVPAGSHGEAQLLGGADALLALQDCVAAWERAGRPGLDRLRLRLTPLDRPQPTPGGVAGRVYARAEHHLEAWLA